MTVAQKIAEASRLLGDAANEMYEEAEQLRIAEETVTVTEASRRMAHAAQQLAEATAARRW